MRQRRLGNSGVKVSQFCLGCMTFGREADESESVRIVHAALERGVTFFDTAEAYQDGLSETILGKALRDSKREDVFVATKVMPHHSISMPEGDLTRRHLRLACEGSLLSKRSQSPCFCHAR